MPEVLGPPSRRGHPHHALSGVPREAAYLAIRFAPPGAQLQLRETELGRGRGWQGGLAAPAPGPAPWSSRPMGPRPRGGAGRAGPVPTGPLCPRAGLAGARGAWPGARGWGWPGLSSVLHTPGRKSPVKKGEHLVVAPERVPPQADGVGFDPQLDLRSRIRMGPEHLLRFSRKKKTQE